MNAPERISSGFRRTLRDERAGLVADGHLLQRAVTVHVFAAAAVGHVAARQGGHAARNGRTVVQSGHGRGPKKYSNFVFLPLSLFLLTTRILPRDVDDLIWWKNGGGRRRGHVDDLRAVVVPDVVLEARLWRGIGCSGVKNGVFVRFG